MQSSFFLGSDAAGTHLRRIGSSANVLQTFAPSTAFILKKCGFIVNMPNAEDIFLFLLFCPKTRKKKNHIDIKPEIIYAFCESRNTESGMCFSVQKSRKRLHWSRPGAGLFCWWKKDGGI
jgi:hypothetical protein